MVADTRSSLGALAAAALALTLLGPGCALEGEIFGPITYTGMQVLPQPKDTVLFGQSTTAPAGRVRFFTAGGTPVAEAEALVDDEGIFSQAFPGALAVRGLGVWVDTGDRMLAAVLPDLPAQPTVFHVERQLLLWEVHPAMIDVGVASTAVTMIVAAAARAGGVGLDALEEGEIVAAIDQVWDALQAGQEHVLAFGQVVATLDGAAATTSVGVPWARPEALDGTGSFLSTDWLAGAGVDYDADGSVDGDTAAFDAALAAAAALVDVGVCYAPDAIRVVFHLDLRPGVKNLNCAEVNPYKWTSESDEKSVFFTGGVHTDAPVCGEDRTDHCLTEGEIDAVNVLLGNWVPNTVPMVDDGTQGDIEAGDGIWTLVLDLPYIPTATSPDGAGVRLGYKYTFGLPGQSWTDAEEWPGNQRLLELEDLNGDHLVVRYDIFGDEAANKDKVNSLSPAAGGCGTVEWEAERDPDCAGDSRENLVDVDGDCTLDGFDAPGPVAPITVSCDE